MLRILEDLLDRAFLDLVAAEHDHDAVGHLCHHGHVMGDEHHRRAGLALQPVDQGQNLGLDRHVQRGGRLIRDQKARLAGQRHGDHHALAHPAAEFMGILLQAPLGFGDPHLLEQFKRAGFCLFFGHSLVKAQTFGQLSTHREHRIQRRHRLLKDHPDLVAANRAHQILIGFPKVQLPAGLAFEQHPATGNRATAKLDKAHQGQAGDGLARAGFTNDTDGFARIDREGHILDPDDGTVLCLEFHAKVFNPCDGPFCRLVQHALLPVSRL